MRSSGSRSSPMPACAATSRRRAGALDTLAREELGIDPDDLGGSPWVAASASFIVFSLGAFIPVAPFIALGGGTAVAASAILSALGLVVVGATVTIFTGRNAWWSA